MSNSPRLNEFEKLEYAGKYHELLEFCRSLSGVEAKYWEIFALMQLEEYDEAIKKAELYKFLFSDEKWFGKYSLLLGEIYILKRDFDNGASYLQKSLEIFTDLDDKLGIAQTYRNLGRIHSSKFEKEKALELFTKAHQIALELDDKLEITKTSDALSRIYWHDGGLKQADHYHKIAEKIAKEITHRPMISQSSTGLAISYALRGDLSAALQYFENAYRMSVEMGRKGGIAVSLMNIGVLYARRGESDKAIAYLEEAYKINLTRKNPVAVSTTLWNLLSIEIQYNNNIEKAKQYFDQLKELENQENDKWITFNFKRAQALILKSSNRMKDKMLSMEIWEELIHSEEWGNSSFNKFPHLIELLLLEYQYNQEAEILEKIRNNLAIFQEKAKNNHQYYLLVKSVILQAQYEMVMGNFEDADIILEQALIMTEEKDLVRLKREVQKAQKKMQEEFVVMKQLFENNATFAERIEKSSLMQYIKKAQGVAVED